MKGYAVVVLMFVLVFGVVVNADDNCAWNQELNEWDCSNDELVPDDCCTTPYMYTTEEFLYEDGALIREIVYSNCMTVLSCNRAYVCPENNDNCRAYIDYQENILLPCN